MKFVNAVVVVLFLSTASVAEEQWTFPGAEVKIPAKKKGKSKKPSFPPVNIKDSPKLIFKSSIRGDQFVIYVGDGKQKFGEPAILIRNGENTYMRPRLELIVPLDRVKSVQAGKSLSVTVFSHRGDDYDLSLVKSPTAPLPDTVVTKK